MENIQISENFPGDLFSIIPVLGRANGPVAQDLGSRTERTVSLSIELAMEPPSFGTGSITDLRSAFYNNPRITQPDSFNRIYQAARPALQYTDSTYEFVSPPQESFNPRNGVYSYNITWTFGK
jgi:hypothetical protein